MSATEVPVNFVAVTNLLARVHSALRGVDAADPSSPLPARELERVSDAVAAVEEFARLRKISLEWDV